MKAYHLHCIKPRDGWSFSQKPTVIISHKDIEAVASRVDIDQFPVVQNNNKLVLSNYTQPGPKELKQMSRELKSKLNYHEVVVRKVLNGSGTIVPIKFAVIFQNKKSLNSMLKIYYPRFKKLFDKFQGKEEWGIKVSLRKDLSLSLSEKELDKYAFRFFSVLKEVSSESREKAFLYPRDLFKDALILNSAHLISEESIDKFVKNLNKLKTKFYPMGFRFKIHGPHPPYNFVCI